MARLFYHAGDKLTFVGSMSYIGISWYGFAPDCDQNGRLDDYSIR